MRGRAWPRTRWLAALSLALAGCGGAAVAASRQATASRVRYARTPTQTGIVNPRAIPLGDGYLSSSPRVGYVDSCIYHFTFGGGATGEGPWIDNRTKSWNSTTKLAVQGHVAWPQASYKVRIEGGKRVIVFNDLPIEHTTGTFPISRSDPAYRYDRNPNRIEPQDFDWSLPLHPRAAAHPTCTGGGPIGVLTDGVVLYNALDAEGRDAGAHEVLDSCAAHPDPSDTYHHHYVPACLLDKVPRGKTVLVGYALDGYGIYVMRMRSGALPGNRALDACHGTTSRVLWDGKLTRIYHYVATLEYPYTIGCFHGTPISSGHGGATGPPSGGPPSGGPPTGQ